jgi:hypothetical protein
LQLGLDVPARAALPRLPAGPEQLAQGPAAAAAAQQRLRAQMARGFHVFLRELVQPTVEAAAAAEADTPAAGELASLGSAACRRRLTLTTAASHH